MHNYFKRSEEECGYVTFLNPLTIYYLTQPGHYVYPITHS